jgi:hypothetical protein
MKNKWEISEKFLSHVPFKHPFTLWWKIVTTEMLNLSKHIQRPSHENLEIIYVWIKLSNAMWSENKLDSNTNI